MLIALSVAAAVSALLAIAAEWNEHRHRAFYVLKPLTTLLILGVALAGQSAAPDYRLWVAAALILSLAGDVCLMFDGDRWFIGGLSSFLLAHLAFAFAFLHGLGVAQLPAWLGVVVIYGVGLLWVLLPRTGKLKLPVLVYCLVITAMVFAAAARYETLETRGALLALIGALLFMLSDSCLGVRRFVRPYPHAQTAILTTYWAAIGLIAWSA